MNELSKPFRSLDVRLAIAHALNRAAIMKSVFFGHGEVANSSLMPNVTYYSPVGLPTYDPSLAKQELAASPYPHGGFSIDFIAGSGDPVQTPVSQIVAAELKPLGINVKIRELDPSEVTAQEQSFHFGMRETYWTMDIIDPDEYVSFVLCGSCGSFANWTHFNNAQIDKLTTQAETTFNSSARGASTPRSRSSPAPSPPSFGWLQPLLVRLQLKGPQLLCLPRGQYPLRGRLALPLRPGRRPVRTDRRGRE